MLIKIFLKDSSFVKQMVKEGKCSQETFDFLESNIQRLVAVYDTISIPYFRKNQYEDVLLHYCENKSSQQMQVNTENMIRKSNNHSGKVTSQTRVQLVKIGT